LKINIGIDIGSVSIDTVVLDENRKLLESRYDYCHGRPFHTLRSLLSGILEKHDFESVANVALTGTGGLLASELIGGYFINEIIAQSSSVSRHYPQVRTIIEMGGEDSKLIFMETVDGRSVLSDFSMNSICAAGTGSFLDQQAKRIGVSIEGEFGELALKSVNPPRIAGRCSVFAKSDMIHLQQIATPVHDIVAGLCFAVARNFKSCLARGKDLAKPVSFQGGVAANRGMVRAFREVFDLKDGELIVPELHAHMGALGALYHVLDCPPEPKSLFRGLRFLDEYLEERGADVGSLPRLVFGTKATNKDVRSIDRETRKVEVALGLDVGSLSTNVVLIDGDHNVIARRYLPTASRPLEAIRRGLAEIAAEVGERVEVTAVGSTGSGRYLTGDFVGADTIQNEITAQATAAIAYDPTVDTIFEIGGQDSKYISIDDGVIVDFEMNKVCAAGTGSFLEEQSEKLDIEIEEFGDIALSAESPSRLGDRCTVFMESDLNAHQQRGIEKKNLISGLAYSIVYNYIQKVVGNKRIGTRIFFQGGVANNKSVVAAFEQVTGKPIVVPPHFDVTGAIGAAMLARNSMNGRATRFKGFSISERAYSVDKFTCKACSNQCEIRRVTIENESKPLFYGGRCERYEVEDRKGKGKDIPNLFDERTRILMGDFKEEENDGRMTIGIPRGLLTFYKQFPFWRTFFRELGYRIVLSSPTNRGLILKSIERLQAETCFPVEVMHGHVLDLLEKGADYIFLPSVVNAKSEKDNPTKNYNCPWIQTLPFMVRALFKGAEAEKKLLIPILHFKYSGRVLNREFCDFMSGTFGVSRSKTSRAVRKAEEAQSAFERALEERGREVLAGLPVGKEAAVVLGRPYNTGDPELNLHLVEKLINLDVLPIPMDFLPLSRERIFEDYGMMYWPNGRNILAAARIVARDDRLTAVYTGNFRCGPDSFLSHFVREELRGKPYLQIEVDEHSADAGLITRCEAFLDSLRSGRGAGKPAARGIRPGSMRSSMDFSRTMYIPYMCDHAHMLAAASRHFGVDAQVLPPVDEKAVELGRRHTSSKECFPLICTTGSFLKKILEPGFEPKKSSFFMPDHNGPCRFGQYNKLQRIIFNHLGYTDVEIISPGNDNSYEDLSHGHGNKFRIYVWKGFIAVDMLRKMLQERRPYEARRGDCDRTYDEFLNRVIRSVEQGTKDLPSLLLEAAERFDEVELLDGPRRPVVSVTGEIFMRDNPSANGFVARKLEGLGAEIMITPVREWVIYSTYRYMRDSKWAGDLKGILKAKAQEIVQNTIERKLVRLVEDSVDIQRDIHLREALELCSPYVDKSYDGQPALVLGGSAGQVSTGISGVVNILPFTCMPETFTTSVSPLFRKDHDNIPWLNIAYDGQEDTSTNTKLQAFMHQAAEYAERHGLREARRNGGRKRETRGSGVPEGTGKQESPRKSDGAFVGSVRGG
jgi:predicted CoA-substrate-specific enzyme activase